MENNIVNSDITISTTNNITDKPICKFFIKGACKFGESCINSHEIKNRENMPECEHFLKGKCKFGNDCIYAHNSISPRNHFRKNCTWRSVNKEKSSLSIPYYQILKKSTTPTTPTTPTTNSSKKISKTYC